MNTPKAQELCKRLVRLAMVAENFGGSILERWGLSYENMKKSNPILLPMPDRVTVEADLTKNGLPMPKSWSLSMGPLLPMDIREENQPL
jgi:hypothetical protein